MKPKVYVTRHLPETAWNALIAACDVESWDEEFPPPYELLTQQIKDKDGLLCLLTDQIDDNLMDHAPNLKVISQVAVGYDNIDIAAATTRAIAVGNTPGVLTDVTADFTFALLLSAARRIGQAVAKRARGFDMRVLYHNPTHLPDVEKELGVEYREFDDLLRESDFVSIHVSLTEETHGLINSRALDLMKRTAVLINTARGPVVDPEALYWALKNGQIAAAALDVTDPEPIPADDRLLDLPNLIIAPHIASATIASRTRMAQMAVRNCIAGVQGRPLPFPVNTI